MAQSILYLALILKVLTASSFVIAGGVYEPAEGIFR